MTQTENKGAPGKAWRQDLSDAGRDMWLAGLGALATIETRGRQTFESLVEKGKTFETTEHTTVDRVWQDATGRVRALGHRVESGLEETSRTILQRFGIPSHDEITALIARVEQLTAKVEALSRKEAVDDQES
jgi:poly(hydroxyalkanoate) granule-associated protein